MNIITGFVFDETQMQAVEKKLFEIRAMVLSRAQLAYNDLLKDEITVLVDDVILGLVERPNMPVLQAARQSLNDRIVASSSQATGTAFDFQVSMHVFFYNGKTYIRLNTENDIYSKYIAKLDGLVPYNLTQRELTAPHEGGVNRKDTWDAIMSKYKNDQPLGMSLLNDADIFTEHNDEVKKFKYDTPANRADVQTRRYLTSVLMQKIGCNNQIPPFRTMEFLDIALLALSEPKWKEAFAEKKSELTSLLPTITYEMITSDPSRPIVQENQSENNSIEEIAEKNNPESAKNCRTKGQEK